MLRSHVVRKAAMLCALGTWLLPLPAATADTVIQGGEVNIAGATLFRAFYEAPSSSNDFIDVDGDGCAGFFDPNSPCGIAHGGLRTDQLARTYSCPDWTGWWLIHIRSVGSVNGVTEFVDWQLLGLINESIPAEIGLLNRIKFAEGGSAVGTGCTACNASNAPECPSSIDLAITDVEGPWNVVAGASANGFWNRKPTADGYGYNSIPSDTGYISELASLSRMRGDVSLNTDIDNPDENTIYDTAIAWSPIVYISNRGVGQENFSISEMRHLFVAGRLPNGENLAACTRSTGSGTRNGIMNTTGIDPAWGRGDNIGDENGVTSSFALSPNHQPTNGQGSSQVEEAVISRRLGVGYTGLAGSSRAIGDSLAGRYEVNGIVFDHRGGTQPVRPSVDTILDGCDPNTGYMLGGKQTFISRGSPEQTDPNAPNFMANQQAAAYLNNITGSIAAFVEPDPNLPDELLSPGDFLAKAYFLLAGMDCLPTSLDPTLVVPNDDLIQDLQDFIRANNELDVTGSGGVVPGYGTVTIAGKVPNRLSGFTYSDGSNNGNYVAFGGGYTVVRNTNLSERNQIAGDFDNDKDRDADDIIALMDALHDPRGFVAAEGVVPGNPGGLGTNYVIPEIIGDYNGDGDFDADDARYAADGLAMVTVPGPLGRVHDRTVGFTNVDNGWFAVTGDNNYFNTTLATGKTYEPGDSRGDVAGGGNHNAGGNPIGHDGAVDAQDLDYICSNFGDYTDLDQAVYIDLSCDMNADLVIDHDDILDVVQNVLGTNIGDLNLDGSVDLSDLSDLLVNFGATSGQTWANGDTDCDGDIDLSDLSSLLVNFGL